MKYTTKGDRLQEVQLDKQVSGLLEANDVVTKVIGACVLCKKLRGPHLEQRMADLPLDRTEVCPPFTNVGFDVFGP